jgi:murein DD-endopeptidase MepM/ murein hydrolase activator NlpD
MLPNLNWFSKKKASLTLNTILILFILSYSGLLYQVGMPGRLVIKPEKSIPSFPVKKFFTVDNLVGRGDTIISVLKREGLDHLSAYQLFMDVKPVYDLKQICAGKQYSLHFSEDRKVLKEFRYEISPSQTLIASKDESKNFFITQIKTVPYEVREEYISGEIEGSLFGSILAAGEKPELADLLASLYEYDIDFNRDIQKQDAYRILVEKLFLNGKFIKYGNILISEFTNRGKTVQVLRYTDQDGKVAYYHPDGRSVRKMFLRCPLPFMRVTSSYGFRNHPILGFSAQHNGIDLHAPYGTAFKSTASGIVRATGYSGSKGNFICIEHTNHYISHYYHLSRYADGIKAGKRVEQGQVIGYVGSTGWSTGPHLHYGMQKDGKFLNPLKLNSPTSEPLKEIFHADFKEYTARLSFLMSTSKFVRLPSFVMEEIINFPSSRPLAPVDKYHLAQ